MGIQANYVSRDLLCCYHDALANSARENTGNEFSVHRDDLPDGRG